MNDQELMSFAIARSNDPIIKNPVLRDAMNKDLGPRTNFDDGGKVDEVLKHYKKYLGMRKGKQRYKVIPFTTFFEEFARENFGRGGKPSTDIKLLNTAAKKYGYKDFASVPTNKADRSNILRDAKRRESGAPEGKGRPGVKKDYKITSPMSNPEVRKKQMDTRKKEYQKTPEGKRLQWVADNSKDYNTPDKLKAAYEKHFKHKVGSKADALFNIQKTPGARGGVGSATGKKINFGLVDGLQNFNTSERGNLMFITKGFSEDELFKGAILQNNPKVQTQFKNLFEDIHKNVSLYSELGPEGIVERLKSQGGNLLNDFDFIKSYSSGGTQTYGGVHSGITRNSLLNLGVPEKHLTSYQTVRKPLQALGKILLDLKNRGASERYGISNSTAFKISSQLESFLKGEGNLRKDIAAIDKQLGDVKFNNIFGGVNFEHTLAKQFGKDYKYLPRNYLLKGQFTTAAFNQIKKNAFDLPLIDLMKKHEQGKVSGKKVQAFIDDFNAKTNNYADFKFDVDKGRLGYTDTKVSYDLSRYDNPNVARQELIDNIKLTQSDVFQKGMKKTLPKSKEQLKLFKSKEATSALETLTNAQQTRLASMGGKGCNGNFAPGGPVPNKIRCITKALDRLKNPENLGPGDKLNARKLFQSAGAKKFGNFLKGFGIPGEIVFEAAFAIPAFLRGESGKRILGDTLLGFLGAGQSSEEEFVEYAKKKGLSDSTIELISDVNRVVDLGSSITKKETIGKTSMYSPTELYNLKLPRGMRNVYKAEVDETNSIFDKHTMDQPQAKQQFNENMFSNAMQLGLDVKDNVQADRDKRIKEREEMGIISNQNYGSFNQVPTGIMGAYKKSYD